MSKNLYVGNLPFQATDDELRELFGQHGEVSSVNIITDRETGRSRGFAFVEMADGGDEAINTLNGQDFMGRALTVNEARPRTERSGRGGSGGGGFRMGGDRRGGGGGGYGGGGGGYGGRR